MFIVYIIHLIFFPLPSSNLETKVVHCSKPNTYTSSRLPLHKFKSNIHLHNSVQF